MNTRMVTTLDENDYLAALLYSASKSPRVKRARLRSWMSSTALFLLLAFVFYDSGNEFLRNWFLAYAIIAAICYPWYSRWKYKSYYNSQAQDLFKNRFGLKGEVEFTTDAIVSRDRTCEIKIVKSEIEEINETQDYYFFKSSIGLAIVVPKAKTTNIESIREEIASLTGIGVKYNVELNWKWK